MLWRDNFPSETIEPSEEIKKVLIENQEKLLSKLFEQRKSVVSTPALSYDKVAAYCADGGTMIGRKGITIRSGFFIHYHFYLYIYINLLHIPPIFNPFVKKIINVYYI